jgi:hypothetical protein
VPAPILTLDPITDDLMTHLEAMVVFESISVSERVMVTCGAMVAVAATLDWCANGDVVEVCFPEGDVSSRDGILASRIETDRRRGVVSTRRMSGAEGAEGRM